MTDYSAHLIAARKALATAEAYAALHQWQEAAYSSWDAEIQLEAMRAALHGQDLTIDTEPRSSAK